MIRRLLLALPKSNQKARPGVAPLGQGCEASQVPMVRFLPLSLIKQRSSSVVHGHSGMNHGVTVRKTNNFSRRERQTIAKRGLFGGCWALQRLPSKRSFGLELFGYFLGQAKK